MNQLYTGEKAAIFYVVACNPMAHIATTSREAMLLASAVSKELVGGTGFEPVTPAV
jgi:hypothetical protein